MKIMMDCKILDYEFIFLLLLFEWLLLFDSNTKINPQPETVLILIIFVTKIISFYDILCELFKLLSQLVKRHYGLYYKLNEPQLKQFSGHVLRLCHLSIANLLSFFLQITVREIPNFLSFCWKLGAQVRCQWATTPLAVNY